MNLAECEDKVLHYFQRNGFHISEWTSLQPIHTWRPPIRVRRVIRGRLSDAAIIVREDSTSYKRAHDWKNLGEVRRNLPNLSIYFAIPDGTSRKPLIDELQELGIGLYIVHENGNLIRVQVDRVPFEDATLSYPIDPTLPYRNRVNLHKVFNNCTEYLWWLDKHFRVEGFNLLCDWCYCKSPDIPDITEVLIIGSTSVGSSEVARLRRNFPPFQAEMNYKGIHADMRILKDTKILGQLHDRYILSASTAFNVLPVGSIIRGQYGSLYPEENPPDFVKLWNIGVEL